MIWYVYAIPTKIRRMPTEKMNALTKKINLIKIFLL